MIVAENPPKRANAPSASGGAGVEAAVPAASVPRTVAVPPGVVVRSAVPVPEAVPLAGGVPVDPGVAGVPVDPAAAETVAPGVPGVPSAVTVVAGGGRVAVGCARAAAPTVAETRACTVPSTFTGAAVPPHAATAIPRINTPSLSSRDTGREL